MAKLVHHRTLFAFAALVSAGSARAQDGLSVGTNGVIYKSNNFDLSVGGRFNLDGVHYDTGQSSGDNVRVRRARIEVAGKIAHFIKFRVDREFTQSSAQRASRSTQIGGGWRNVWVAIEPTKHFALKGGNFVVPFSMEELQNSNRSALMERSDVSSLAPSYSLGAMLSYDNKHFTVSGGYFGKALDEDDSKSKGRGEGFAGRVTFAPVLGERTFVHLGAAYEQRDLKAGELLRFVARSGSQFAPALMSTGRLYAAKTRMLGAEAAYSVGPFLVQAQYAQNHLERDLLANLDFSAWYAQAAFIVTGQTYEYSKGSGTVGGVRIKKRGALELAARVSGIDLRDGAVPAGIGRTYTGGVNYYMNRNVRFMVNYARSRAHRIQPLDTDRKDDLITGRFQLSF